MHPFKPTPVLPETTLLALQWERVVARAGRSATNSHVSQNLLVLPILLLLLLLVRILLQLHPRLVRILLQLHPQLVERFVKLVEMATSVVHLFLVKLVVNQKIVPVSRGEYSLKENG